MMHIERLLACAIGVRPDVLLLISGSCAEQVEPLYSIVHAGAHGRVMVLEVSNDQIFGENPSREKLFAEGNNASVVILRTPEPSERLRDMADGWIELHEQGWCVRKRVLPA